MAEMNGKPSYSMSDRAPADEPTNQKPTPQADKPGEQQDGQDIGKVTMSTLILWNISKALEKIPYPNIKEVIQQQQSLLQEKAFDVNRIISEQPEQRHVTCALLAWQQMGHKEADSLCRFIDDRHKELCCPSEKIKAFDASTSESKLKGSCKSICESETCTKNIFVPKLQAGPVYRLPVCDTRILRVDSTKSAKFKKPEGKASDCSKTRGGVCCRKELPGMVSKNISDTVPEKVTEKIKQACCKQSSCMEKLAQLEKSTNELRKRAAKLAQREAERAELLERAEIAWQDLERGYERRLRLALEKEEDIVKQFEKAILERNTYKSESQEMAKQLKDRGDAASEANEKLTKLEAQVCEKGCERIKLAEESRVVDEKLADEQCKATQLDRDLQFKEEQAQRKVLNLESELDSTRALIWEAERAMRAELTALKEQIKNVSQEFLDIENEIKDTKNELEELRKEKAELSEDLEGCVAVCDKNMAKKVDLVKQKTQELNALKEKVVECKCKVPIDKIIEVKRTPSLAELCRCEPEDKLMKTCSCTSLRSSLLSSLLADLFGGLQAEIDLTSLAMPCQMLKCLEDKHSWDGNNVVIQNLRTYFSKLLLNELEIAIVNSIEKAHVRWIGASCADKVARDIPDLGEESLDWERKAVEQRAQVLANEMAEQMFKDKTDELLSHTKKVLAASGPPPCECNKPGKPTTDKPVLTCLVPEQKMLTAVNMYASEEVADTSKLCDLHVPRASVGAGSYMLLERTITYVEKMRHEIKDLKKETLKKGDLESIEQNIAKLLVEHASVPGNTVTSLESHHLKSKGSTPAECENKSNTRFKKTKLKEEDRVKVIISGTHFNETIKPKSPRKLMSKNKSSTLRNSIVYDREPANPSKSNPLSKKAESLAQGTTKAVVNQMTKPSNTEKKQTNKLRTYAVNWCMCGSKRPKRCVNAMAKSDCIGCEKDVDSFIENITSLKSSNGLDMSCSNVEGEDQAVLPLLFLDTKPSNKSIDRYKTPIKQRTNEPICKKECVCLNKIPSSKSIDRLLETLTKWNSDLGVSDHDATVSFLGVETKDLADTNNTNPRIEQLKEQLTLSMSHAMKSWSRFPATSLLQEDQSNKSHFKSSNTADIVTVNDNLKNKVNKTVSPFVQQGPPNTQSVYMAAINLDKSNENNCKCVADCINAEVNTDMCLIIDKNSHRSMKQINSAQCKKSGGLNLKSQTNSYLNRNLNNEKALQQSETFLQNNTEIPKTQNIHDRACQIDSSSVVPPKQNIKEEEPRLISRPEETVKSSTKLPSDCGYEIKFLGVTLNAVNHNRQAKTYAKDNKAKYKSTQQCSSPALQQDKKSLNFERVVEQFNAERQNSLLHNFKDLKEQIYDSKYVENNKEKSIDTRSLLADFIENQSCVCCNEDKDETHNLEINAFHLLKDHLKQRFYDFDPDCKSECLHPEIKNQAMDLILSKVKQTVSDEVKKFVCKCAEEEPAHGSWNRANSLLQEYLKTKINRVHCKCSSEIKNTEVLIPDVTAKVCLLIEKDFEKLKDLCQCLKAKNDKLKINDKRNLDEDLNSQLSKIMTNERKVSKQVSNKSMIEKQTISAQIGMETRSHEVLVACDMQSKSVEAAVIDSFQDTYKSYPTNPAIIVAQCSTFEKGLNDIASKTYNISHVNEESGIETLVKEVGLPLIGSTVDCTCNQYLGPCICSKATVEKNNKKIQDIWYDYLSSSHLPKTEYASYMMNKIKIKENKGIDNACTYHSLIPDALCVRHLRTSDKHLQANNYPINSAQNTKYIKNIALKDSDKTVNLPKTEIMTTTNYDINVTDPQRNEIDQQNKNQVKENSTLKGCLKRTKSDCDIENSNRHAVIVNGHKDCQCGSVPICHVKMLVESLSRKLVHGQCTCDSLDRKVCPVHSTRV